MFEKAASSAPAQNAAHAATSATFHAKISTPPPKGVTTFPTDAGNFFPSNMQHIPPWPSSPAPAAAPWQNSSAASAPAPTQSNKIFCTQCGNAKQCTDKFCNNCGAPTAQQDNKPQRPSSAWQAPLPESMFFGLEAGEEILNGNLGGSDSEDDPCFDLGAQKQGSHQQQQWGYDQRQEEFQQQPPQREWTREAATANEGRRPHTSNDDSENLFD